MDKTNGDHPIYPQTDWGNQGIKIEGLTKREYFAAMAMQGFLANSTEGGYKCKIYFKLNWDKGRRLSIY